MFKKTINFFFSFEVFYVCWIFSYQFKNAVFLSQIPDTTILLTCLVIPWAFFLFLLNHKKQSPSQDKKVSFDYVVSSFCLFSLWIAISTLWSDSYFYMLRKSLCYGLYTVTGFFIAYYLIAKDPERIKKYLLALVIFAFLIHLEVFRFFIEGGVRAVTILETNYLVTGQTIGAGFLAVVLYLFYQIKEENIFQKTRNTLLFGTLLLVASTLLYVLLNLGARGPVFAVAISLLLVGFLNKSYFFNYTKLIYPLYFIGFFLAIYLLGNYLFNHSSTIFLSRILTVFDLKNMDINVSLRIEYYISALKAFLSHPFFGLGLGGWPIFHGLGDIEWHPHNIFLEILSETGIIGFLLFLCFLLSIYKRIFWDIIKQSYLFCILFALVIFSFLNALKTGDLHDNTFLFTSLSLLSGAVRFQKNKNLHL